MQTTPSDSQAPTPGEPTRRQALKAGLAAAALTGTAGAAKAGQSDESLFLPEEAWRERMTPPADNKRFGWVVDTRRCFGCHGCEVACKAENDVPLGHYIRQTIYHDHQRSSGAVARIMVPMACQHCEDAPCIKACPCGSMHKGAGGTVMVNYDTCSGHTACKEACPYGAIYIDPVANQAVKCHNCTHRIDEGMDPACVSTCPSEALYFGDLNDPESPVSKIANELGDEASLETLRPEKGTRPRMSFVVSEDRPLAAWEGKVPREGESYSPDAYSVFNWGEEGHDSDTEAAGEEQ
jgi:tetrathionate reductase subunit B